MPIPARFDPSIAAARWRRLETLPPIDAGARVPSRLPGSAATRPDGYIVGGSHAVWRPSGGALVDLMAASRLQQGKLVGENDMQGVLQRIEEVRTLPHVAVEELGVVNGTPIQAVHFGCADPSHPPKLRVLVTGGVHGNEPVGPGAVMLLIDQLLAHPELRDQVEVTLVPVVNPVGYRLDNRRNGYNKDVNRHYSDGPTVPAEVAATRGLMQDGQFDMVLDLHSAKSGGNTWFVLRKGGRDIVHDAMRRFGKTHALLPSSTSHYTMEAPGAGYSDNPGTLKGYAADHGAIVGVTLEAPRETPYRERVVGMCQLVREMIAAGLTHSAGIA